MNLLIVVTSVFFGFCASSFLVMTTIGIFSIFFNVKPNFFWLFVNLMFGGIYAAVGGYITAFLPLFLEFSMEESISSVFGLAILMAIMSGVCAALSLFQSSDSKQQAEPVWYHIALLIISNIGIFYGAKIIINISILLASPYFPLSPYLSQLIDA